MRETGMFKKVEYVGFEGQPNLRELAERTTAVLGNLIHSWRDEVMVTWRPAPIESGDALELTLGLTLWNAADSATSRIQQRDFAPGEEVTLRSNLREVWSDLLAQLSDQQMKRLDEIRRELVEV
jgi:hypothetical protein